MTTSIQTSERTFNKNIINQVMKLMPTAKTVKTIHVSSVGYVHYIKDINNNTLGKVFMEFKKGMKIYID